MTSAHSSVRMEPKLPSFKELKLDDKIQMELQKRLHQYDHTSKNEQKVNSLSLNQADLDQGCTKFKK